MVTIYRETPDWDGLRTALVGYTSDVDALKSALAVLRAEGFQQVIGPMEGSTWGQHRLVTDSDGRAPFLMEPVNPPGVHEAFEASGMQVVSRYISSIRDASIGGGEARDASGVRLRPFDPARADGELAAIHALSLEAFASNRYYAPISLETFVSGYRPVLPILDPDLVLLAEDEAGVLKGFLFAIPDFNEGARPSTVILKTYASRAKGLGSVLANAFHEQVRRKGYREVIHALMHEDNLSARHSDRTGGRVFRRYALWGARL